MPADPIELSDDLTPPLGRADVSHRRPAAFDRFRFGVCYYPEHWDAATRARDPERMKAAGMSVARMAEFAWNVIEPSPGRYDFSLFDETIDALAAHGIDTILCTPTATPPRWLLAEHPDLVRVDAKGRRMVHGSRQHGSHFHEGFRRKSIEITRAMADHYAGHASVIGWQTDNELHCHFSEDHSDAALSAFQAWCEREYGEIATLNNAWGTIFWNQTFDDFAQLTLPTHDAPTYASPAHLLAYYRFLSDGAARFQRDQIEVLRAANADWWITHNGTFRHIDYRGPFGRDLDVLGYDSYPMFHKAAERATSHAFNLDRVRAYTGNFAILEHQAGAGGQSDYMLEQPLPGEMRQQCYRSIARGADALLMFRWRTCRTGAEQAWLGLIDHDDVGRRRYDEAVQLGGELARVGPAILGTRVAIDAAIAGGDATVRDAHAAYPLGLPDPDASAAICHAVMLRHGLSPGVVHPSDDLGDVRLYVIPHWARFDAAWVEPLRRWVEAGGTLVVGARTASRDLDGNLTAATRPGVLADFCGVRVAEYGKLDPHPDGVPMHVGLDDRDVRAEHWYELLEPFDGAGVAASWSGGPFHDRPAITMRSLGRGNVVYLGTYLTPALCDVMCATVSGDVVLGRPAGLAPQVEHVLRVGDDDGRRIHFFLNNGENAVAVDLPPGRELTADVDAGGRIELARFGVAIVREG